LWWETAVKERCIILSDCFASNISAGNKYGAVMTYLDSQLVTTVSATQQFKIFAATTTALVLLLVNSIEQCCTTTSKQCVHVTWFIHTFYHNCTYLFLLLSPKSPSFYFFKTSLAIELSSTRFCTRFNDFLFQ